MLSIVYITRNRCNELIKSILSCEKHISIQHEYVVIDNGSDDATGELIKELTNSGIMINYQIMEENKGVSGGRVVGFKQAKGDVCYFIDDDATIVSNGLCLDEAYNWIKEQNDVYALGTDCYDTERKKQLISSPEKGKKMNSISKILTYVGCSHFIYKKKYNPENLYPRNLMYGSEELYSGLGIYASGGCIMHYPRVKVLHEPSNSTREGMEQRQRHGHINTYIIKKYYLKFPFSTMSSLAFLIRLLRFENYRINKVCEDIKEAHRRYDKEYKSRIGIIKTIRLVKCFGFSRLI